MNIKQLNVQAAVPLTVMGLLTVMTPSAEAVTFNPGDVLSGQAAFQVIGDSATSLNFDFLNEVGQTGTGGTFGVNFGSTGGFEAYINGGATTNPAYSIQDTDFGSITSITSFLSFDEGSGGRDPWSMDWNNISITNDSTFNGIRFIDIVGDAVFRGSNTVSGTGGLAPVLTTGRANARVKVTQGGASFVYAVAVPEPFTILGTVAAIGFGGLFQLERSKRQQKAQVRG